MFDALPTTPRHTSNDPLAALDRETLARVCYVAKHPELSAVLTFAMLYAERQEHWREYGDRLREGVDQAMREALNQAS